MACLRHSLMLGSSGAGKSTLANRLRGYEVMRTKPVREHDSRGRPTTTHRELIALDLGWLLMDVALDHTFADVAALAAGCPFGDCRHQTEPGCAVRQALEDGRLDAGRWGSFQKLEREIAHLERSADPKAQAEQKQRWKAIHKEQRRMYPERRRK